jgi:hypothetical protein
LRKVLDLKAFAIGAAFLLAMVGLGTWLFNLAFWKALLIGIGCMLVLGLLAEFEGRGKK